LIDAHIVKDGKLLAKTEVAGSGFINFFIARERLYRELGGDPVSQR